MTILRHYQNTEAITGVEKLWRHFIVGKTQGINAHFFEFLHTPLVETIGQSDADTGEVLVIARALDLDALPDRVLARPALVDSRCCCGQSPSLTPGEFPG